jgi:hypothetical protein
MNRGTNMNDKGNYRQDQGLAGIVENESTTQAMSISKINDDSHPSIKKGSYRLTLEGTNKALIFARLGDCASFILTSYLDARLTIDNSFSEEETAALKKSEHLQNLLGELKTISYGEYDNRLKYLNQQIKNMDYSGHIIDCLDNVTCAVSSYLSDKLSEERQHKV